MNCSTTSSAQQINLDSNGEVLTNSLKQGFLSSVNNMAFPLFENLYLSVREGFMMSWFPYVVWGEFDEIGHLNSGVSIAIGFEF
jgi:hypothetical protein